VASRNARPAPDINADEARSDFAAILKKPDFVKSQLALLRHGAQYPAI